MTASRRLLLAALALLPAAAACSRYGVSAPSMLFPPEIPFFTSSEEAIKAMLEGTTASDVVYDLGCGDGRIVIAAAWRYGARGVGVDIDPRRISEARYYADQAGVAARTQFDVKNIFDTDVSPASIVTIYMSVDINRRLRPMLWKQLRPGSRVVTYKFDMGPEFPPERTVIAGGEPVHFWTVR